MENQVVLEGGLLLIKKKKTHQNGVITFGSGEEHSGQGQSSADQKGGPRSLARNTSTRVPVLLLTELLKHGAPRRVARGEDAVPRPALLGRPSPVPQLCWPRHPALAALQPLPGAAPTACNPILSRPAFQTVSSSRAGAPSGV